MNKYNLLSCVWELTLRCNLNCIHCGSTAGKERENELIIDESIRLCYDLKKTGCRSVALMGGEPLLSKNFWQVAKKIKELDMDLCVITNGTIYNDEMMDKLKELKLQALATSLDGANPDTHDKIRGFKGAFKKTLGFIDKALERDIPVSVITTVSKLNILELNDLKEIIKGRNIAWQIQMAGSEGERFSKDYLLNEDEFYSVGLFIETMRRRYSVEELPVIGAHDMGYNSCLIKNIWLYDKWEGCQAGISVIGIRSNGDVLGCLSLNNDSFIEGNVREKSLYDIWNSKDSFSYTRKFRKEDAGENCKGCKYLESCKGGCSEISLSKTGKLHNDPYCFYRFEKKNFNYFKRLWYSMTSKANKNEFAGLNKFFSGKRK
ncbi:MAG: radical SAM protein [Elusimicrobiota bacterium]